MLPLNQLSLPSIAQYCHIRLRQPPDRPMIPPPYPVKDASFEIDRTYPSTSGEPALNRA